MKQSVIFVLTSVMLAGVFTFGGGSAIADEVDDILGRIKTYRFGQSRDDMNRIEAMANSSRSSVEAKRVLAGKLASVLETDATYDCKQFICRQLVLIAGEEEVAILSKLLTEQEMSHMALYAMVAIPGETVNAALREALGRAEGRAKTGIINALGDRQDSKAVEALGKLAVSSDADISVPAAWALGRIGGPEAAKSLHAALSNAKEQVRTAIADAYLACADRMLDSGDSESASKMYYTVYLGAHKGLTRAAALLGMAAANSKQAMPFVVKGLSDEDGYISRMAARIAREAGGRAETAAFAEQLGKLPAAGQAMLLSVLADRGDKAAVPAIEASCKSEDERVRAAALLALGRLGDSSAVELLAERAARGTASEQEAARKSLTVLQDERTNGRISQLLGGASAEVKVELIKALAERGAEKSSEVLLGTAVDGDRNVRVASYRALRGLGGCEDVRQLVELLAAADSRDKSEAVKTVVAVARRCGETDEQSGPVIEKLSRVEDASTRSCLVEALGKIGGANALGVLRKALGDPEAEVRTTAIRALAEWPTDEPLGDLLAVVRDTKDQRERVLALRGYIRLIGVDAGRNTDDAFAMYREAMRFSTTVTEKKLVLSGLASTKSISTLEFAGSFLDEAALRQEAEVAAVEIGRATCGTARERTAAILRKVISGTTSDTVRSQAQAILETIRKLGDFVTTWQVSPYYEQENAGCTALFDIPFGPEGPEGDKVVWRVIPAGTIAEKPWLMDILGVYGGENRVAYVRTSVVSEREQEVILELGSDDGVKVWLNGKMIHANNAVRASAPAQEKVRLTLQKGANSLMLKITQNVMGWEVCAQFKGLDGSKAEGLRFEIP